MYIEFETMQREIVIWLDNAEDILRELDQLKEDSELSDNDINKFKVKSNLLNIFLHDVFWLIYSYTWREAANKLAEYFLIFLLPV